MSNLRQNEPAVQAGYPRPGKRRRNQFGFTLLELMVSVGIMGALSGVITISLFAMLKAQADTNSNSQIAIEVSKSTRWVARDIHRATSSDVIDSAPAVATANFTWMDGGSAVTCVYSLNGGDSTMERACGGISSKVANGISGLQFTRSGDLVSVSYTVTSSLNTSRTENVELLVLIGGG